MTTVSENYKCLFPNCGKSFKRQEHLTRHEKSHDPSSTYVCQMCGKEFNRKDSLNRHTTLHRDDRGSVHIKKTKQACIPCRKSKSKCDGEEQCKSCIKRDLNCIYEDKESEDVIMHDTSTTGSDPTVQPAASNTTSNDQDESSPSTINDPSISTEQKRLMERLSRAFGPSHTNVVNWQAVKIRQDLLDSGKSTPDLDEEDDPYKKAFYHSVHHHWEIIHRPSYSEDKHYVLTSSSIRMIGAWVHGTEESRLFALTAYEALQQGFITRLQNVTSHDRFQQKISAGFFHAALYNVIFTLYWGSAAGISRGAILLSVLVSSLRQVSFFSEYTAHYDDHPMFPPMKWTFIGQRSRLAYYLFKADAYLSILGNHPPILSQEELHFTLPSAYATYNADGLNIWDARFPLEPKTRLQSSIFSMLQDLQMDRNLDSSLLIEDIHLRFCAMWSDVWKTKKRQKIFPANKVVVDQLTSLELTAQMNVLRLEKMINHQSGGVILPFTSEPNLPLHHYHGFEDSEIACIESMSRFRSLVFSATSLYHLHIIHLSADIPSISRLAKDQNLTPIEIASDVQQVARPQRIQEAKDWFMTSNGRRALCHAVDLFVAHKTLRSSSNINAPASHSLDPIAYISLTFAALIVWVCTTHTTCGCQNCVPSQLDAPSVELTSWSYLGWELRRDEREIWIEVCRMSRPRIQGLEFCSCNTGFMMKMFRELLPEKWEVGGMIFGEGLWESWS